jgi:maltoporin
MATQLDRQRTRATLSIAGPAFGLRWKAYGELEGIPSGTFKRDDGTFQDLPADWGATLGGELTIPGPIAANLFARYSVGLTAYDWLSAPFGFSNDMTVFPGASELVLGVGANFDRPRFGVQLGAYVRDFHTASPADDPQSGWEYVVDARPWLALAGPFQAAVDLSVEQRFPAALSPTALEQLYPTIVAIAPMLLLTPTGPGSFARPQLRLVYRLAHLEDGARDQYPVEDPRHDREWVQYLGIQAEWWFDSTYR